MNNKQQKIITDDKLALVNGGNGGSRIILPPNAGININPRVVYHVSIGHKPNGK